MSLPPFHQFMLPILEFAADGGEKTYAQAMARMVEHFNLTQQDVEERIGSGGQTVLYNRVTWACTYLARSGLLDRPRRGRFRISDRGGQVLAEKPSMIDLKYLEQFPEYKQFREVATGAGKDFGVSPPVSDRTERTPEERLSAAHDELRSALAEEVMARVGDLSPAGFERLVLQVLVALGYGGGRKEYATVTGRSGDGGIDGIIQEDKLGLDMVYVQAKRWEGTVGPGEIDKFIGSLMRRKAHKGVFITNSTFTSGAIEASKQASVKVRLIDGDELANLMIDFGVGVSAVDTYVVKRLDSDFFEDLEV